MAKIKYDGNTLEVEAPTMEETLSGLREVNRPLTLEEMAEQAGVDPRTVRRWEDADPAFPAARRPPLMEWMRYLVRRASRDAASTPPAA